MYLAVNLKTSLSASSVLALGFNLYHIVANIRYQRPPAPINRAYNIGWILSLLNAKLNTNASNPEKLISEPRNPNTEIRETRNSRIPKTGVRIQMFSEKKLAMNVTKAISNAENKIPFRICFVLPLTSLGEHQNAPKPIANPIFR